MVTQKKRDEPERFLGDRLRQERLRQGRTLRELARSIDVSASLISAVETGRTNPSVSTLYAMTEALGIPPAAVLGDGHNDKATPDGGTAEPGGRGDPTPADQGRSRRLPVVRRRDRKTIELASGSSWELLTPVQEPRVEFLEVVYRPQGSSGPAGQMIQHAGREYGVVTKGTLFVALEFNEYQLRVGDSIAFDSTVPHRLWNPTADDTHAIWFVLDRHVDENVDDSVPYLQSHIM
jgi:transcriptional regulator with XRE-family HTH domain/quercetin dioxygenase-like cupin family protein